MVFARVIFPRKSSRLIAYTIWGFQPRRNKHYPQYLSALWHSLLQGNSRSWDCCYSYFSHHLPPPLSHMKITSGPIILNVEYIRYQIHLEYYQLNYQLPCRRLNFRSVFKETQWNRFKTHASLLSEKFTVTAYVSMAAGILAGIILGAVWLKCCLCRKKSSYFPPG